jgi:hypothetical protein
LTVASGPAFAIGGELFTTVIVADTVVVPPAPVQANV